jgi:voltage-gated potassium channel
VEDLQRQLRLALLALFFVIPTGIMGFMLLENWSFMEALWVTFITLATIGYGDFVPQTIPGRLFTILLVIVGFSVLASALNVAFTLFISPEMRAVRQRRRIARRVTEMKQHYIICGKGEIVDKTIGYLLNFAENRRRISQERAYEPIDHILDRIFGDDAHGNFVRMRTVLRHFIIALIRLTRNDETILDVVVVVTDDMQYAAHLRSAGLLVIEGNPTDSSTLRQAGVKHSRAMMVVLDNDTETLLTVLAANNLNRILPITAAVLDEDLGPKIVRVGATNVLPPYDLAGQFLNNATFRPAVNEYFNSLLFDSGTDYNLTQLEMYEDSQWIGKQIGDLRLRERYAASIIGIRRGDGGFAYAPPDSYTLEEDETLIVVSKARFIPDLIAESRGTAPSRQIATFQTLHFKEQPPRSKTVYTLIEAEEAIKNMSNHFIICGSNRVARSSINKLNPERPFVIISHDNLLTTELLRRGFRVVHGSSSHEQTLIRAGVQRAQAIMVAEDEKAESVLTILTSRTLNKRILITATAMTDDMLEKLERAGADRVVSPFHVAARFILLATTRPEISEFLDHVIYNYQTGLETTEIYLEDTSPWIGQMIGDLQLDARFQAGVIGLRLADRVNYLYTPPADHVIEAQEVLIIVTPIKHSDELRDLAYGSAGRRPMSLRRNPMQSDQWTRDILRELIEQRGER